MGLQGGGRAEHKLWENDANSLQFAAQVGSSCTLTSNPIHKREPLLAFSNRLKPQLQSQGFQFVSPILIHFCMTPNWKTRSFQIKHYLRIRMCGQIAWIVLPKMPNPICNTNCARLDSSISVSCCLHVFASNWNWWDNFSWIVGGFLDWEIPKINHFFLDFPL